MTACVQLSRIVVLIKINIRTIKIRVSNKQLVHDQKWDIESRTIIHDTGYHQIKKNANKTNKHVKLSMI